MKGAVTHAGSKATKKRDCHIKRFLIPGQAVHSDQHSSEGMSDDRQYCWRGHTSADIAGIPEGLSQIGQSGRPDGRIQEGIAGLV